MTNDQIIAASQTGPHCFLYREAIQHDWIDFSCLVRTSGMWYVSNLTDRPLEEQIRAYLCESLATALDHADMLIAFRAYSQAQHYAGRLSAMGSTTGSRHCDALLEARNRIEARLRSISS